MAILDAVTQPVTQVIQGAGNWAGYVGAGASNLLDAGRFAAINAAGYGQMALAQVQPVAQTVTNVDVRTLADMPLSQIERQYGSNVAERTQEYFTMFPTEKSIGIQQQYAQQRTNIIGSSGTQQYIGETADKRFAVYSEAGGTKPFAANVLTDYQKGAVGAVAGATDIFGKAVELGFLPSDVARSAISSGLAGIRGFESGSGLILSDFGSRFAPAVETTRPGAVVAAPVVTPVVASGNFISDFFGSYAKSGYAAGASTIQPFAGAQQYTPVYESLMAKPAAQPSEAFDLGGFALGALSAGQRAVGSIIPSVSAAEPFATTSPFVYNPKGAGSDIGSPLISQPTPIVSQPSSVIYGDIVPGPVRSKAEALDLGQIASAAKIDVFGRVGYTANAPVGSQQWAENLVELSSAYHNIAQETGKQQPANPFEYTGDLSLSYLKGTNKGSASSTYGENITDTSILKLPEGLGIQDVAWQNAKAGKGGEQPAVLPGYETAIKVIESSSGQYGPYATLYGGTEYGKSVTVVSPEVKPQVQLGEPFYQTTVVKGTESSGYNLSFGSVLAGSLSGLSNVGSWVASALSQPQQKSVTNVTVTPSTKVTVSGGNETITKLGSWLDQNRDTIDRYNVDEVNRYNTLKDTYNEMSKQNPVLTTTSTETVTRTTTKGSEVGGERGFLSGIYEKIGIPSVDLGGVGDFASGVGGFATRLVGTALNPKYETVSPVGMVSSGGEASTIERYGLPLAVGTIAALTIGSGTKASPVELPTLPQYDLNVPERVKEMDYTGLGFVASARSAIFGGVTKAQELWEGGGAPINIPGAWNLPKITDVTEAPLFKAPGEGFKEIAKLPGEGLGLIAQLPGEGRNLVAKVEGAISLPFSGGSSVIQMPKSVITPEDVISPGFDLGVKAVEKATATAREVVSERPIFDLNVDAAAKSVAATREAVASEFAPDYAAKLAAASAASIGTAVATPLWWTQSTYQTRAEEQSALSSDFVSDLSRLSESSSYSDAVAEAAASAAAASSVSSMLRSSQEVTNQYDTLTGGGSKAKPTVDIKTGILPLPRFDYGGGGGGGGTRNPRRALQIETFYIGPRARVKKSKIPKMPKARRKI